MNVSARDEEVHSACLSTAVPPFSVVIPAHDEEAVIARCLQAILQDKSADSALDIIVAVNGSKDRTAQIAHAVSPEARVIELPHASKAAAIGHGFALCRYDVRFVVDADVITSYRALAATAQALTQPGVMAASPAIEIDLSRSSALVRAYYRVWQCLPYVTDRLVGGGVYGLSPAGLRELGDMPEVIADDLYVRTRFGFDSRRSVSHDASGAAVATTIYPPRHAIDLVRTEARRLHGKLQVDRDFATAQSGTINGKRALAGAFQRGASLGDMAAYGLIKLLARTLHAWNHLAGRHHWSRDLASRAAR